MNVNTRLRFIIITVIIVGFFATLFVQLIQLTIVNGEYYAEQSAELKQREIRVSGARGSILDRNGLPLAYDQKSYNVQFYRDPTKNSEMDRAYYTGIIIDTIEIIERNDGEMIDSFAIQYESKTGEYEFYFGDITPAAAEAREADWRKNMYIRDTDEKTHSPEEIYMILRTRYQIPSEVGYEEARKVLSVWQDVQLARWVAYKPVDIAYNVSIQTVAEIETHSDTLDGMSIADSTVRIYPRKEVAAHTIGYLGRITTEHNEDLLEETGKQYTLNEDIPNLGYSVDDLIGVEGIEKSMEQYLTGNSLERQGKRVVEIDNMALVINELSATQPKQGDNVMLTLDIPLQMAVQKSLAENIPKIRQDQLDHYDEYKDVPQRKGGYEGIDLEKLDLADSGAAVVIDVHTGEILAMDSYPSFDLNLFTGGISNEVWEELDNDPANPLFNKAVASRAIPGSIFKMVTGLAGLMEGAITLDTIIDCKDKYTEGIKQGSKAPECHTNYPKHHADQTIVEGLKNSCNYFFYTVADKLGINLLDKWADKFGFSVSTGVEIPGEAIGQVYEENILYDSSKPVYDTTKPLSEQKYVQQTWMPYQVKKQIRGLLDNYAKDRNLVYDETLLDETAEALLQLMAKVWEPDPNDRNVWKDSEGTAMGADVRAILAQKMNIGTQTAIARGLDRDITSYLVQLRWAKYDTITTGIGQGVVQVTPLAVARYVAALVNGGIVYETHVVDKVIDQDGNVVFDQQPVVYDTLDAPDIYLEKIKLGMEKVVSDEDGTAQSYFKNFKYKEKMGGKTGTAQVSTIDLENNSWFVCFAPYDEPEIAVVVFTPNGYKGGLSTHVAQDIVAYYIERKMLEAKQTIPAANSVLEMPEPTAANDDNNDDNGENDNNDDE